MLSEDINNISVQMGEFAGKVNQEEWEIIKAIRMNLSSIAERVEDLENWDFAQNVQPQELVL